MSRLIQNRNSARRIQRAFRPLLGGLTSGRVELEMKATPSFILDAPLNPGVYAYANDGFTADEDDTTSYPYAISDVSALVNDSPATMGQDPTATGLGAQLYGDNDVIGPNSYSTNDEIDISANIENDYGVSSGSTFGPWGDVWTDLGSVGAQDDTFITYDITNTPTNGYVYLQGTFTVHWVPLDVSGFGSTNVASQNDNGPGGGNFPSPTSSGLYVEAVGAGFTARGPVNDPNNSAANALAVTFETYEAGYGNVQTTQYVDGFFNNTSNDYSQDWSAYVPLSSLPTGTGGVPAELIRYDALLSDYPVPTGAPQNGESDLDVHFTEIVSDSPS